MANNDFTCPHCNKQIKVIPQGHTRAQPARTQGQFESVAPLHSGLKGFLMHVIGNKPYSIPKLVPRPTDMTLHIETWNHTEKKVNFDHMDKRIKVGIVQDIARMIIDLRSDWTRENLVKHTRLSENATRVYVSEFKRLGYLEVSANNRSFVTSQGRRFLRGILSIPPTDLTP